MAFSNRRPIIDLESSSSDSEASSVPSIVTERAGPSNPSKSLPTKTTTVPASTNDILSSIKRKEDVTLDVMIAAGIIVPGEAVLTIFYNGDAYTADLTKSGKIKFNASEFNNPTAFYKAVIELCGKETRQGGWNQVIYEGKNLAKHKDDLMERVTALNPALLAAKAADDYIKQLPDLMEFINNGIIKPGVAKVSVTYKENVISIDILESGHLEFTAADGKKVNCATVNNCGVEIIRWISPGTKNAMIRWNSFTYHVSANKSISLNDCRKELLAKLTQKFIDDPTAAMWKKERKKTVVKTHWKDHLKLWKQLPDDERYLKMAAVANYEKDGTFPGRDTIVKMYNDILNRTEWIIGPNDWYLPRIMVLTGDQLMPGTNTPAGFGHCHVIVLDGEPWFPRSFSKEDKHIYPELRDARLYDERFYAFHLVFVAAAIQGKHVEGYSVEQLLNITPGRQPGSGLQLAHKCGNSFCVNPNHIRVASTNFNIGEIACHSYFARNVKMPEKLQYIAKACCHHDQMKATRVEGEFIMSSEWQKVLPKEPCHRNLYSAKAVEEFAISGNFKKTSHRTRDKNNIKEKKTEGLF